MHIVLEKKTSTQKLNFDYWTMKMRSRSHDICPLDMFTLQSFHTTNIVDLLHMVWEKQTKTQKLNYNHWTMKIRSRSDDTCQLDMYTFQSFHTPNILALLLIVSEIWTWPPKLNLVHWSMKWGRGQVKTVWRAWGPWKVRTYQI